MYFHGYIADLRGHTSFVSRSRLIRKLWIAANPWGGFTTNNLCLFTNPTEMLNTNPSFKFFPNYRHKRLTSLSRAEAPSSLRSWMSPDILPVWQHRLPPLQPRLHLRLRLLPVGRQTVQTTCCFPGQVSFFSCHFSCPCPFFCPCLVQSMLEPNQ